MSDDEKLKKLKETAQILDDAGEKYMTGEREFCSFCGKERAEPKRMFSGPGAGIFISSECVVKSYAMLGDDE